jgi:hypothetical protein
VALKAALVAGALIGVLAWSGRHLSYDVWGGILVFPVLLVLTIPLARRTARQDGDPGVYRLMLIAFVLKEASAVARYFVAFSVYGGNADANHYHLAGMALAPLYRHGYFNAPTGRVIGTNFLSIITGWVYVFTGPTKVGGFLVFSWFGFIGLYMCYRAFRVALPDGDRRRYARLLFFLPSLLFWPSSIGKESWMMLCLGVCALGIARLMTHAPRGFVVLIVGMVGLSVVRPHITLLVLGGLIFAYVLQPSRRKTLGARSAKVFGVLLLLVGIGLVVRESASFFNEQSFSPSAIVKQAQSQTQQGGSSFKPPSGQNPVTLPLAIVTVLFRPFPFEAHNAQELLASLEGTVLFVIFIRSWRRIKAAIKVSYRQGYVAFCAMYSLLFVVAFSAISNFGIISRERVQLYPFVIVLICLPAATEGRGRQDKEEQGPQRGGIRPTHPAR